MSTIPRVLPMPNRPAPSPIAQQLSASDCAEVIARMIFKSGAARRNNHDLAWEQAHVMERSECRTLAEFAVALYNPAVVSAAETETVTWVREKLRAEHGEDYPTDRQGQFADALIEDAVGRTPDEFRHQVLRMAKLIGRTR